MPTQLAFQYQICIEIFWGSIPRSRSGAGGASDSSAGQNAAAILIENNNYVSFISAGAANSDTRYDAALHDFRNFGTGAGTTGAITGLRYLTFSDNNLYASIINGTFECFTDIYIS